MAQQLEFRRAIVSDAVLLAAMNRQLIRDEGHRNRMSVDELEQRMRGWLQGEYQAVVFECEGEAIGYALFCVELEFVYLRQFLIQPDFRRQGLGRAAVAWLFANAWPGVARVRLEVLVGNVAGIAFWRSLGFEDYALTLERE